MPLSCRCKLIDHHDYDDFDHDHDHDQDDFDNDHDEYQDHFDHDHDDDQDDFDHDHHLEDDNENIPVESIIHISKGYSLSIIQPVNILAVQTNVIRNVNIQSIEINMKLLARRRAMLLKT